jgi:hypothetical protein
LTQHILTDDLRNLKEKECELQDVVTFDSNTLFKVTRLTEGILALTDLCKTIQIDPSHEDDASIGFIKESFENEKEIALKLQAYTEQFCYETYQWLLTIRKTVSDFPITPLKQGTYENSTRLSLLNLLESLTFQWDSLNLFSMNSLIPNLNERTSNTPYTFPCVTQKGYTNTPSRFVFFKSYSSHVFSDLPIISIIEDFLRLIIRLTRFLLKWDSNKSLLFSLNATQNKTKSLTDRFFGHYNKNVKSYITVDEHCLLKFITSIISFYVGSFCYAQCIVSELLHNPVRLLYVETSEFLLDIINICLKLVTIETFQLFVQTFVNVYKM